jgi:hypothetical protein
MSCYGGSSSECTYCNDGYFLNLTSCLSSCPSPKVGKISNRKCEFSCDKGYFIDSGDCTACDDSCETCTGSTQFDCTTCFQGSFLDTDGECVSLCA